jgi:hypothetical protein
MGKGCENPWECCLPPVLLHIWSPRRETSGAPKFIVAALRDPGPGAAPLQRLEIVKGWVEGGTPREEVLVVAGGENDAGVDLATCERHGQGADRLCSVWTDSHFDASQPAFYYARLLENPSCRWSQWACVEAAVDCREPSSVRDGFEACCSERHRPAPRAKKGQPR